MQVKVKNGTLVLRSLITPLAIGYFIGWGILVLPMLLLMLPIMMFSPGVEGQDGQLVTGPIEILMMVAPMFLMMPIILLFQGFMLGSFIVLGLWLYRNKREIIVVETKDSTS
ncbi:MAG: hypothetical protein AAF720_09645 [Pseudomonadota bacterium]